MTWIVFIASVCYGSFVFNAMLRGEDDTSQPDEGNVVSIDRWRV